jgi:hypothetical protein
MQFGRVTVIEVKPGPSFHKIATYQCRCGNTGSAQLSDLKRGKVQSCGCALVDSNKQRPHAKGKHWRWSKTEV